MEQIIVLGVTLCAGYYLWRRFFSSKGGCGCSSGCSNCDSACEDEKVKMSNIYGIKEEVDTSESEK